MHQEVIPDLFGVCSADFIIGCKAANRQNRVAVYRAVAGDACVFVQCLHDFSLAVVQCDMAVIADDIACTRFIEACNLGSKTAPAIGCCIFTVVRPATGQNLPYKVGAVNAVRQRVSAPDIRSADKLFRKCNDTVSG